MAGSLGAMTHFTAAFTPYKPYLHYHPFVSSSIFNRSSMAHSTNGSPETDGPATKVQKLDSDHQTPLFKVKKLSEKAVLPSRGSSLAAGYDLSSAIEIKVPARGKALVATDLSIAVPEGTYARIAPRSGLAWKHSIDVGAGVIDADYRGPVGVILFNYSDVDFEVKAGDRIAQLIIEQIITPEVVEVDDLDSTVRGAAGEERVETKPIPWTSKEEMSLAKAWLEITEDPKYSNYQKDRIYWTRIYELFLKLENQPDGYRDVEHIGARWRKMRSLIQSFNKIYNRLSNSSERQSGSDDAMLQVRAQNEFRAERQKAFPYLDIWQFLRGSSKFHIVIAFDPTNTRGQPSAKRSKTSSSNDPGSQGSDARSQINLNDIEEDLEEQQEHGDEFEPPQRSIGRDKAKKAIRPSSNGVRIDYTETFEKVSNKLNDLLQLTQQRLNLKKEHDKLKERRRKAIDFQILTIDTTNLSGAELALAKQMKQEILEKYNFS